jgi:hypothetical protein
MNPRPEIERKGWGIAPPERVFMAMEMLARGDRYYANLLLDVPPVGVFDMADITWEDAHTWIESFRTFTQGGATDSFRIPVLAEHQKDVKFIPLGKDPNAIMYDTITLKYASMICAAYGMTTSDIDLQGSSTLAGSIRSEQKTNRTGKARNKGKIKYFIEGILPPTLQFDFIDTDGERLSMLGRARLANATAMNQFHQMGAISPEEGRLQMIQDGIFTISMPEKPPKEAAPPAPAFGAFGKPTGTTGNKPPERPGSVGSPQAPSLGGDGEVKKSVASFAPENLEQTVSNIVSILAPVVYESIGGDVESSEETKSLILKSVFSVEDTLGLNDLLSSMVNRVGTFAFRDLDTALGTLLSEEGISVDMENHIYALEERIQNEFPAFLGKAIVYTLTQSDKLLNPTNIDGFADFTDLADEVSMKVKKAMPDYLSAHIDIELQNIVAEIQSEIQAQQKSLPEQIQIRTLPRQAQPINVTVNPASITMPAINISSPIQERSKPEDEMQIIINNPQNVDMHPHETLDAIKSLGASVLEMKSAQPAPIVNVTVSPTPINNEINVSPTPIELTNKINLPPQTAPVVNVEVNPTPVTIENTVLLPERKKREIVIVKDNENTWHGEAE